MADMNEFMCYLIIFLFPLLTCVWLYNRPSISKEIEAKVAERKALSQIQDVAPGMPQQHPMPPGYQQQNPQQYPQEQAYPQQQIPDGQEQQDQNAYEKGDDDSWE